MLTILWKTCASKFAVYGCGYQTSPSVNAFFLNETCELSTLFAGIIGIVKAFKSEKPKDESPLVLVYWV